MEELDEMKKRTMKYVRKETKELEWQTRMGKFDRHITNLCNEWVVDQEVL